MALVVMMRLLKIAVMMFLFNAISLNAVIKEQVFSDGAYIFTKYIAESCKLNEVKNELDNFPQATKEILMKKVDWPKEFSVEDINDKINTLLKHQDRRFQRFADKQCGYVDCCSNIVNGAIFYFIFDLSLAIIDGKRFFLARELSLEDSEIFLDHEKQLKMLAECASYMLEEPQAVFAIVHKYSPVASKLSQYSSVRISEEIPEVFFDEDDSSNIQGIAPHNFIAFELKAKPQASPKNTESICQLM